MRTSTIIDPSIVQLKFRNDPVVIHVTKFDEPAAKKFNEEIAKAHDSDQPLIPIVIDSYGGFSDSLFSMISDIEHAEKPIATITVGKAMSCGGFLLTFGTKGYRFIDRHARIMIHEISSGVIGNATDQRAESEETNRLNDHIFALLARNCKKKDPYFLNLLRKKGNVDWFITPEEALEMNMVDFIGVPKFVKEVKVEYSFGIV